MSLPDSGFILKRRTKTGFFPLAWILFILMLFFVQCRRDFSTATGDLQEPKTRHHFKILFVGSSLTSWSLMPQITGEIALSMGDTLDISTSALGSGTFQMHVSSASTCGFISEEQWDFVILQENGALSAVTEAEASVKIFPYAVILDSLIHAASPLAQIILYMPPAYQEGQKELCESDPELCDFNGMQERIIKNTLILSRLIQAPVAPVGVIWQQIFKSDSSIILHDADKIHANRTGAYATACTIYSTIFQQSPVGAAIPDRISEQTGLLIQDWVSEILLNPDSDWYQDTQ
jgi:hypothetical protein